MINRISFPFSESKEKSQNIFKSFFVLSKWRFQSSGIKTFFSRGKTTVLIKVSLTIGKSCQLTQVLMILQHRGPPKMAFFQKI